MRIFSQISPLRAFLNGYQHPGFKVGLVPTMGALHDGHLTLLEASKKDNALTVCSIYVNPTQFNNADDLASYPRTLARDTEILEKAGCDVLFCPSNEEMYPGRAPISFDFGPLDKVMEGRFRPGHFSGVALVVAKLLHIVEPHHVYFGQKDWQQGIIIKTLIEELKFNVALVRVPTARATDGLALSSRNLRLTVEQRAKATLLHEALSVTRAKLLRKEADFSALKGAVESRFAAEAGMRLEYFELVDAENLNSIANVEQADRPLLCIACYVGEVRLIDNMLVDLHDWNDENTGLKI